MRNDVVLQKAVLRQPFLFLSERKARPARLISERITRCLSLGGDFMENGENAYRRYLDGDDGGITEIIRLYKDGLIFYIKTCIFYLDFYRKKNRIGTVKFEIYREGQWPAKGRKGHVL